MPDRIIRDELLRSPRYRTLSSDTTRLLFLHLLLCVDNLGNYEANPIAISDAIKRHLDDQTVSKLLTELADVDLIRLYQDEGKHYLHIPRFRQRLKYLGSKHPRPPVGIEDNEIRELIDKYGLKAGHRQATGGIEANEVKRSEVKRSEVKRSDEKNSKTKPPPPRPLAPPGVSEQTWTDWCKSKGKKLTPAAYTRQVAMLAQQPDPNACVERS